MENARKYKIVGGCFEGVEVKCVITEHLLKQVDHIIKPFVELKFLL